MELRIQFDQSRRDYQRFCSYTKPNTFLGTKPDTKYETEVAQQRSDTEIVLEQFRM